MGLAINILDAIGDAPLMDRGYLRQTG